MSVRVVASRAWKKVLGAQGRGSAVRLARWWWEISCINDTAAGWLRRHIDAGYFIDV